MNNLLKNVSIDLPDHHFKSEIPLIIWHLDLSMEEICVYCHLKSLSNQILSSSDICNVLRISLEGLIFILNKLSKNKDLLDQTALIYFCKDPFQVEILDIWRYNGNFFNKKTNKTLED